MAKKKGEKQETVKSEVEKNKGGRPTTYTQEIADNICAQLIDGSSLRSVCRADDMPAASTVFLWLREHKEFSEQYARAKRESADALVEDMLDIADDASNDWMIVNRKDGSEGWQLNGEAVQRSRLRIDTRKWMAMKLQPKKYGERVDLTSDGEKLAAAPMVYLPQDLPRDIVPNDEPEEKAI